MQISSPNDDTKLQALNRRTELTAELKQVEQLKEPARLSSVTEMREDRSRVYEVRRQSQRRKRQRSILLDTRDAHERRASVRREEDREHPAAEDGNPPQQGIDVKA